MYLTLLSLLFLNFGRKVLSNVTFLGKFLFADCMEVCHSLKAMKIRNARA